MSLLRGFGGFASLINAWAQEPAKAAFQIGLTLVGIYLLAYALYGVRGGINRLYQGSLPRALDPLERLLRRNQIRVMGHHRHELSRAEAGVDDASWPTDFDFGPTWVETELNDDEARRSLDDATRDHAALLSALGDGRQVREEDYRALLARARVLCSRATRQAVPSPSEVEALVTAMKRAYAENPPLRTALHRISNRAMGEWTLARGEFAVRFPENERWLRPTRLGNMVAALEYAVFKRYWISLTDLWPRMLHVVADDVRSRVEDANAYVDFTLMMSFLSAGTVGVALVAIDTGPARSWALRALLVALPLVASWLFYQLAMSATRAFAEHVRAAVDLFRLDLLDALSIERPRIPADEQPIWDELERFIAGADVPARYVHFAGISSRARSPSPSGIAGRRRRRPSSGQAR
ncbi:MAG TPA: hypothetical protein VFA46_06180 [Actinomycetes bacterium]|nr:hypothetical protein [Actinomycetes bacterium]